MKQVLFVLLMLAISVSFSYAGFLDDIQKTLGVAEKEGGLSNDTVISGLKEALNVSTRNAVDSVSRVDGYFGNADIRIPFPENIGKVADILEKIGYRKEVDVFVLSMNRAAEKAAPQAVSLFIAAVKEMSFADARRILDGSDTAATEYFKRKTSDRLYRAFKPVVSSSMDEVGVTRSYKELMWRYTSLPFVKEEFLDLDNYVTGKALEGLFHMVAKEERRIRTDPAARVTRLLRKVFGS